MEAKEKSPPAPGACLSRPKTGYFVLSIAAEIFTGSRPARPARLYAERTRRGRGRATDPVNRCSRGNKCKLIRRLCPLATRLDPSAGDRGSAWPPIGLELGAGDFKRQSMLLRDRPSASGRLR
jgi:hypothetical protein